MMITMAEGNGTSERSGARGGTRALRRLSAVLFAAALLGAAAAPAGAAVYPRASQQPSQTIDYIDMEDDAFTLGDLLTVESLQGIVNREEPRIWVLKNPVHMYDVGPGFDANSTMVGRDFWFDRLTGYTKVQHTDPLELVQSFATELVGAVLYDPDMLDVSPGANGNAGSFYYTTDDDSQYAEANKSYQPAETIVAQLNVTAMLCAKYGAIALTEDQLDELEDDYGVTLPVLADTRTLDLSTWQKSYDYAMDNLDEDMRTDIVANNPNFSLAMFDYLIANKIFVVNLKGDPAAGTGLSMAEKALTDEIADRSGPNTPVIGVWGGTTDEDAFGRYFNPKGKFSLVTSESFNLSWTSGLPSVRPSASESNRNLTYDPSKTYISFTETDGDTLLFLQYKYPHWFGLADREEYPIAWELASTIQEIDPLVGQFYEEERGDNAYVNPVTGVGYLKYAPSAAYRDDYFDLTDDYMDYMRYRLLRTMNYDRFDAIPYTAIPSVEGVFAGYGGADPQRPSVADLTETNFMYLGKPVFINYSFADAQAIKDYDGGGPAFFSVAAQYVNTELLTDYIDSLPASFVVVSPGELVDLYKQYAEATFSDIDAAGFLASFTHDESGYLYADDGSFIADGDHRVADGAASWTYRFDLANTAASLDLKLDIANNYKVEVSTDAANWTTEAVAPADIHDASNRVALDLDLSSYLTSNPDKTVYVRFGDASPTDGWGASLFGVGVNGDIPQTADRWLLTAGKQLGSGQFLVAPSGGYNLTLQSDGNLVLYSGPNPAQNTGVVWQSGATGTTGSYFAIMQSDGNFVVYKGTGPADNQGYMWSSGTGGSGASYFSVEDDGKVYVHEGADPDHESGVVWSRP
ncbi:GxGYxYP domain-containing protein [Cohnella fermenti]|uniref:Bulb-type lectin domain-containing protein n=1 Tax=Cohnella fermenti TaxID=2565925 RepID=A0A4S4C4H2_9BACL|nr:GxGYxYP domain-containing protein [Cohnella fermenti]THF82686.1 hypothetical protein E6C55_06360 [Cohnella fermenti]